MTAPSRYRSTTLLVEQERKFLISGEQTAQRGAPVPPPPPRAVVSDMYGTMILMVRVRFSALLEALPHGRATYLVVRLPEDESDLIDDLPVPRVGFQGVRVEATVGTTVWKTTLFPDRDSFLLLVARKVAADEALAVGQPVDVTLTVQ